MFWHTLNREKGRGLKIISQFWTFRYTGVRYSDILLYLFPWQVDILKWVTLQLGKYSNNLYIRL